jgi:hypothetical protein
MPGSFASLLINLARSDGVLVYFCGSKGLPFLRITNTNSSAPTSMPAK